MFTLIFLSLFLIAWAACGALVWLVASVATRGEAGLLTLPLGIASGPIGGLAVPLFIREDGIGIWLSMAAAVALPALVVGSRLFVRQLPPRAGSGEERS